MVMVCLFAYWFRERVEVSEPRSAQERGGIQEVWPGFEFHGVEFLLESGDLWVFEGGFW